MDIVWDPNKARANRRKHGVAFPDAEAVLFDPFALTCEDEHFAEEQRLLTVGTDALGRVLVVVYTVRESTIRLISARKAARGERMTYEERV